jgi:hypothetical protein
VGLRPLAGGARAVPGAIPSYLATLAWREEQDEQAYSGWFHSSSCSRDVDVGETATPTSPRPAAASAANQQQKVRFRLQPTSFSPASLLLTPHRTHGHEDFMMRLWLSTGSAPPGGLSTRRRDPKDRLAGAALTR